jgi:hypothetical protein
MITESKSKRFLTWLGHASSAITVGQGIGMLFTGATFAGIVKWLTGDSWSATIVLGLAGAAITCAAWSVFRAAMTPRDSSAKR